MNEDITPSGSSGETERKAPTNIPKGANFYRHKYSHNRQNAIKFLGVSLVLGALLLLTVIGWTLTGYKLSTTNAQYLEYQIATRDKLSESGILRAKVQTLESELSALQEDLAALTIARIPDLIPITYDLTAISDQKYLQNVIFSQTGTSNERHYEYRALLRNNASSDIKPDVRILLFDALGIQVGVTNISQDHATSAAGHDYLGPGESRTYSSQIYLNREAEPRYFLVEVR